MYAVARLNTFDPDESAASAESKRRFSATHRAQAGYVGTIVIDLGEHRELAVNLWESREHSIAGLAALAPDVGRLMSPLLSEPSTFIGAGRVITADFPAPHM